MGFPNYDADPNNNTTISGINIAEGCAPSGINNAIRQIMADAKAEDGAVVHRTGAETISGAKTFPDGATVYKGSGYGSASMQSYTSMGGVYVTNNLAGSAGHSGSMQANGAGNFGLYDNTRSKWLIANTSDGATVLGAGEVRVTSGATVSGAITASGGITLITSGGSTGIPATSSANQSKFLRGDGTWNEVLTPGGTQTVTGDKAFQVNGGAECLGKEVYTPALKLRIKNMAGTAYDRAPIRVVGTSSGGDFGYVLGNGGTAMLAAGECASDYVDQAGIDGSAERAYIIADANVTIVTNLNGGYDGRKTFNFTTGGNLEVNGGSGTVSAASFTGNAATATSAASAGTATNASSLGGVSAGGYMRKTTNIQRGSAALYTSGTTVNAGYVTSKTITFGSAFGGSTPHVMAIVRGGANSYAPGMNCAVTARTASNCTISVRSTYTSAVTTSAASYIDYVAFYF